VAGKIESGFSRHKTITITVTAILAGLFLSTLCQAEMKALSDDQLSGIYAEGFSDFTITPGADGTHDTMAWFNIRTSSYIEIDSMKLGYHNEYDYKNPIPTDGWDEDWTGIKIGGSKEDPSKDFQTEGAYLKANFSHIDDPAQRQLNSIEFGATSVTGDISAVFNSFSGTIDDSGDNTPEYNGHNLNLGARTISCNESAFSISLSLDGYDKGYWVNFSNASVY